MVWVKFAHIAALCLWMAALFYVPAVVSARRRIEDQLEFALVRRSGRFAYLFIASPAACIAIGTGTALLFLSDARQPWMFLKLAVVGVLIFCHYRYGSLLSHLTDGAPELPVRKARLLGVPAALAALAALWIVLAKPEISNELLPAWLLTPAPLHQSSLSSGSSMRMPI